MKLKTTNKYLWVTVLYLLAAYSTLLFFDKETLMLLGKEDGLFETFGAICFFVASIFFFISFLKSKAGNNFIFLKTKKNIILLLFAFAFFFAAGEEISWGQRIFDFKTPQTFEKINIQDEFNIHNIFTQNELKEITSNTNQINEDSQDTISWLMLFNFNILFSLFCLFYCGLIPLLNKFIKNFSLFFKKINLPIIPIWLGIFFVVVIVSFELIELSASVGKREIVEIKECNLAFLFMVTSIYLYGKTRDILEKS